MAEYVSREEARKILCDVCGCFHCDTERCPFWQELDKLPIADVIERKHGKWNWVGFNIECSECGAMPNFDSTEPLYNFCPNCGARMDGEADGWQA